MRQRRQAITTTNPAGHQPATRWAAWVGISSAIMCVSSTLHSWSRLPYLCLELSLDVEDTSGEERLLALLHRPLRPLVQPHLTPHRHTQDPALATPAAHEPKQQAHAGSSADEARGGTRHQAQQTVHSLSAMRAARTMPQQQAYSAVVRTQLGGGLAGHPDPAAQPAQPHAGTHLRGTTVG